MQPSTSQQYDNENEIEIESAPNIECTDCNESPMSKARSTRTQNWRMNRSVTIMLIIVAMSRRLDVTAQDAFFGNGRPIDDATGREKCLSNVCLNGGSCLLIKSRNTWECACPSEFSGELCEVAASLQQSQCAKVECFNGGTCLPASNGQPICLCKMGFMGTRCESAAGNRTDPCRGMQCEKMGKVCKSRGTIAQCVEPDIASDGCSDLPCRNGGVCRAIGERDFACQCSTGFDGTICDQNVDDCTTNPCGSNGQCQDGIGSFTCQCDSGFTGELCDQTDDPCGSRPCQNGGTCRSEDGNDAGFSCICTPGYGGEVCATMTNICAVGGSPCTNGICRLLTSLDSPSPPLNLQAPLVPRTTYECFCTPGYTGTNCTIEIDECQQQHSRMPCRNGGECIDGLNGYTCECKEGFTGQFCGIQLGNVRQRIMSGTGEPTEATSETEATGTTTTSTSTTTTTATTTSTATATTTATTRTTTTTTSIAAFGCSSPCLNDGVCVMDSQSATGFVCQCDADWSGDACDVPRTSVGPPVCGSEGCTCSPTSTCVCNPGYTGDFCETDIRECIPSPCLNGAECVEYSNPIAYMRGGPLSARGEFDIANSAGYQCLCTTGWTGVNCETADNTTEVATAAPSLQVECELNPCYFGERCVDGTQYNNGHLCIPRRQACSAGRCGVNGERCVEEGDSGAPICDCKAGWGGERCERESAQCPTPCSSSMTCVNGECQCKSGMAGEGCDQSTVANFGGNSLMTYTSESADDTEWTMTMQIRAPVETMPLLSGTNNLGSVVYNLRLVAGFLQLQWFGIDQSTPISTLNLRSTKLSTGEWQTIRLSYQAAAQNTVTLRLQHLGTFDRQIVLQSEEVTIDTPANQETLRVRNIKFGGASGLSSSRPGNQGQSQFVGCLRDITLTNGTILVPSDYSTTSLNVNYACDRSDQCLEGGPTCAPYGTCRDVWTGTTCQCQRPYLGATCETEVIEGTYGNEHIPSYSTFKLTDDEVASQDSLAMTDFSVLLRTRERNGTIAFIGSSTTEFNHNFLTVEIRDGQLNVRLQLAASDDIIHYNGGPTTLNDGNLHTIRATYDGAMLNAYVNGTLVTSNAIDAAPLRSIDYVLLGAYPTAPTFFIKTRARRQLVDSQLIQATFKGVLQDPQLNGRRLMLFDQPEIQATPLIGQKVAHENVLQGTVSDDNCADVVCGPAGRCETMFNDHRCVCQPGWKGDVCEQVDRCVEPDICPPSTECLSLGNGFICTSSATYTNDSRSVFSLTADATNPGQPRPTFDTIQFSMRTRDRDALLMYATRESDFLALYLADGALGLRYRLGSQGVHVEENVLGQPINDGQWHTVKITLLNELSFVQLDQSRAAFYLQSTPDAPISSLFTEADNSVYMGNIPASLPRNDHFDAINVDAFEGCLRDVRFGDLPPLGVHENDAPGEITFLLLERHAITVGCHARQMCVADTNPCVNNSTCVDVWNARQCECLPGYQGDVCEISMDNCASSPCQNGAVCVNGDDSFTCACAAGYSGTLCELNVNECQSSTTPCLNGGTCTDTKGSFTCLCTAEYTGDTCAIAVTMTCEQSPCKNDGVCSDVRGASAGEAQFTCECTTKFGGLLCDVANEYCTPNPCAAEANCTNDYEGRTYKCDCPPGMQGAQCSDNIDECLLASPCQNGGTCVDSIGSFTCVCVQGWRGIQCELDVNECTGGDSARESCNNGGTCTNTEGGFNCKCQAMYSGSTCEIASACASNPCPNTVKDCFEIGDGGFECRSIVACASNPCKNGKCVPIDESNFKCDCDATGFEGERCESDINECSVPTNCLLGTCTNTDGSYTCECNTEYIGKRCAHVDPCLSDLDVDLLESIAGTVTVRGNCKNGGECTNANVLSSDEAVTYDCECVAGFTGDRCSIVAANKATSVPLTFILAPILGLLLLACIIVLLVFCVMARQKRQNRGHYSPSRQEVTSTTQRSNHQMAYMMKPPPQEGLI